MPRRETSRGVAETAVALPVAYLHHPPPPGQQQQQQLVFQQHGATMFAPPALGPLGDGFRATPWVEIMEQPKQRGLRFRYKCEGRSAGSILGERSTNEHKSFPRIKIHNFDSSVAIVVVSCVTHDQPYSPHPHSLLGTDCKDGVCTVKIKGLNVVTFTNIGIQCCKRQEVADSLNIRENMRVNPFGTSPPADLSKVDLSTVRLCFQAFLPDSQGKFTRIVTPVVSQTIIDKKSVRDLVICRLSRQSGYASGGDEVFLLCEKINKDDVQVRFYEETEDGIAWEAFGEFSPQDVHHQYAIVFQTPPYKDSSITSSVQVYIQLRRPSDNDVSDPKPFQYIPVDPDPYLIETKRKRLASDALDDDTSTYRIPSHVLPLALKDDYDEVPSTSLSLKQNLKNKVERRLNKKERSLTSAPATAVPATVPRYAYDVTPTVSPTTSFMTSLTAAASLSGHQQLVHVLGEDGKLYAIPVMHQHQLMTSSSPQDDDDVDDGLQLHNQIQNYDLSSTQYINQPLDATTSSSADVVGDRDVKVQRGQTLSVSDVIAAATSVVDEPARSQR